MAGATTPRVAMLSIRPQYAAAILNGTKQVEFRRRPLADTVKHVVIYSTSPVQRIVGAFEIASIEAMTPAAAWNRHHHVGCIGKQAFDDYYAGAAVAHVIRIGRVNGVDTPFPLTDIDVDLRAPQSFVYLREDLVSRAALLFDVSHSEYRDPVPA